MQILPSVLKCDIAHLGNKMNLKNDQYFRGDGNAEIASHKLMTTRGGGEGEVLFENNNSKEKCIRKGDWNKASCTEPVSD